MTSVGSAFVSRWDKAVTDRVTDRVPDELHDRSGIAAAARAHRVCRRLLDSPR